MKTISEVIDFVIDKSRQMGQNDINLKNLENNKLGLCCCLENASIQEKWDCEKLNNKILEEHAQKIRDLELEQWGLSRELNTIKWIYEDNTNEA